MKSGFKSRVGLWLFQFRIPINLFLLGAGLFLIMCNRTVAHLGPYGSGRARERKAEGKGYAFYHNKAPEYSDPLSAIARLVRLVLKSVGE